MNEPVTKMFVLEGVKKFKSDEELMRDKKREKRKQSKLLTAMKRGVKLNER
jgi:hypothetical protein